MTLLAFDSTSQAHPNRPASFISYSIILIVIIGVMLAQYMALMMEVYVPIGPMYWDTNIYLDGINRINSGQVPSRDFIPPVGLLNYYLPAFIYNYFPNSQPLLLVQWSFALLSYPILLIMTLSIAMRSAIVALAIFIPFIMLSIMPFGSVSFYPFPGVDGFGTYNRHGAQLIYLATVAVFLVQNRFLQFCILGVLGAALFLTKITAFISALIILAIGLLAGYLSLSTLIISLLVFALLIGGLEFATGAIIPYFDGIVLLAQQNQDAIFPRFLTVFSQRLDVVLATSLLIGTLFLATWTRYSKPDLTRDFKPVKTHNFIHHLFGQDFVVLSAALLSGIFYETQNTGSHAFIMLWPILLLLIWRHYTHRTNMKVWVLILALAAILPTFTKITHKALRTSIVGVTYTHFASENLKNLGLVSAKQNFLKRPDFMEEYYASNKFQFTKFANNDLLPDEIFFSHPDFQLLWLSTVDQAITDILEYEAQNNVKFETILHLDFTNPFPFLLNRQAPKYVPIGVDPGRTIGTETDEMKASVGNTDLILQPVCPILSSRREITDFFTSMVQDSHKFVRLSPCYNAYIKNSTAE